MAVIPERRVSPQAQWAKTISSFALILLVTSGVGHRYGLIDTVSLFWLLAIIAMLALLGLGLAAAGFSRLWYHGEKAGRASLGATLMSLIVLAPFALGVWFVLRYPALTDISTDLQEPPRFVLTERARDGAMNQIEPISPEMAVMQLRAYPDVNGRRFDASMDRVLSAISAVIAAEGWKPRVRLPAEVDLVEYSFEAEAPTWLVRLPSDVALRLTDEGESIFVDMRLSQRYGRHDMGDGARRIRAFMAALDAEFARQSLEIIDIPASDGDEDSVD